ncbi:MAG: cation-transporting P-type ATPase, partial [Desulfovibrionales bacterium]|nr:cation-transporting P-type ATPase [Desulfovibrionales bacterium]
MQRLIFQNKNKFMFLNAIFIALGFFSHWVLKNERAFVIALILASIIGVLPIALQAFQALRLKIVSIDVLVTIAVTGAFIIQNFEESAIVIFLFLFGAFLE